MRKRAPKRPADERRRLILEGAQSVFANAGYADAGTDALARAAGVAPSAIYRYFPGKRDLYLAALRDAAPRLLALWSERGRAVPDPLEAIRLFGLEYYDHLQGRSDYARLWFRALGEAEDPDVRSILAENFLAMVEAVARLVAAAQEAGTARRDLDPRVAAWHFMAIGFSFDLVHHLGLDAELDRDRVEAWGRLFIDSLREAPHERDSTTITPGRPGRRTLPVRQSGREDFSPGGGDPLPAVSPHSSHPLGAHPRGGADG